MTAERQTFRRNQFLRMKSGAYKGDLAQVLDVFEGGARLLLRLVPRIDLAQLALPKEQRARGFAGGARALPPQRYIDRAEIAEVSAARSRVAIIHAQT